MKSKRVSGWMTVMAALVLGAFVPGRAMAHCDGLDGPVVKAARQALTSGDLNLALIWIQAGDEAELRASFAQTLAVRKLNPEAKELADRYFFETLVRLHRAGEGAPYTGLKPAGRDLGPVIPAADKSLEDGSGTALVKMVTGHAASGMQSRLDKALAAKNFRKDDVAAGREYVKAYVDYVHYVEALASAVHGSGHAHGEAAKQAEAAPHAH